MPPYIILLLLLLLLLNSATDSENEHTHAAICFTDLNSLSDTCDLKLNRAFITCSSLWMINDCFDADDDDDDDDEMMIVIIIISCSGE